MNKLGYRPGIGAMITNATRDKLLAGKKIIHGGWELPQGGLEDDESLIDCCFREISEEFGIERNKLKLISSTRGFIRYDIPDEFNNEWNGQDKKWFLMEFVGDESDIDLDNFETPEFSEFRWVSPDEILHDIVDFKKSSLRAAMLELGLI